MDKIYGSLLCAAVGDAMSIPAQTKTTAAITEDFGGYIKDILPCKTDGYTPGVGHPIPMVGAGFSSGYFVASSSLSMGALTPDSVKDGLLRWAEHPEYMKFVGPNSKMGISKLQGTVFPITKQDRVACFNRGASSGGAMRAGIVGLMAKDIHSIIDDVITLCMPTHNNTISIAAAAAVAGAVFEGKRDTSDVYSVIDAGMKFAKIGYEKSSAVAGVRPSAGPCLVKRIEFATKIGMRNKGNFDIALKELCDMIGTTIYAVDAIPAAFGCLAATDNAFDAVTMAVNMGDDCSAAATIVGYISGALYSGDSNFEKYSDPIQKINEFNFDEICKAISQGGAK